MAKPLTPSLFPDAMRVRDRGECVAEPRADVRSTGDSPHPTTLKLAPGQSFHGYVPRGTVMHIQQGLAELTPAPRWLAASLWRTTVSLAAGQVHVVATSGWLTLTSDSGVRITCREGTSTTPPSVRP